MIAGLPSLAEIESTSVDHLTGLADDFTSEANLIERSFSQAHELMGAVNWKGQAHDAAYARTDADRAIAAGLAEQRREAAKTARTGAENMLLAKAAASVDRLSGGRLVLGLAVGAREGDYIAAGVEHRGRGKRLAEQLLALREIWEEGAIGPVPVHAGGPKLLVGGGSDAVEQATGELVAPIVGSTLTTVVVFAPLGLLSGVVGDFFKALSITLSAAVLISLALALYLIPLLAEMAYRRRPDGAVRDARTGIIDRWYVATLPALLNRPGMALLVALLLAGFAVAAYLPVGSGFLPATDEGGFDVVIRVQHAATAQHAVRIHEERDGVVEVVQRGEGADRVDRSIRQWHRCTVAVHLLDARHVQARQHLLGNVEDLDHLEAGGRAARQEPAARAQVSYADRGR